MSVMKDVTNYLSTYNSEDEISDSTSMTAISANTTSSRRPRVTAQTARQNFLYTPCGISSSEEEDSNECFVVETPPETPRNERVTVTKKKAPVARKRLRLSGSARKSTLPPVSVSLLGLTKDQLVKLITEMCKKHPEMEKEVRELSPEPDLDAMEGKLQYLKQNIFKSFPRTRFGSNRDAFCYRRVAIHLNAFKKECSDQARTLMSSQLYMATIKYVLMAWDYVEQTPVWDNSSQNKSRNQCFCNLAVQCKNALKKSSFTKEQYEDIKDRIEDACEANDSLKPCLELVENHIKRLS